MPEVVLVGEPAHRVGVVSFLVNGAHPHDIGTLLDQQGVAVRTGHHCTMPLMQRLEIPGTVRASFSLYNSTDDVERFVAAMRKTLTFV
jgi:cysteine desulfurase/selenocysteine lyase